MHCLLYCVIDYRLGSFIEKNKKKTHPSLGNILTSAFLSVVVLSCIFFHYLYFFFLKVKLLSGRIELNGFL